MMDFYIQIEDSAGNKLGPGPITSAEGWESTSRMDQAGSFAFTMPASDEKAAFVQKKRIARAYALINDEWTEIGAGIIDKLDQAPDANGQVMMSVSGDDLARELDYRSVGFLGLATGGGGPVSQLSAVASIATYAPAGWVFSTETSPPVDAVYGQFAGESILAAAIAIAEKTQSHFRVGPGRLLEYFVDFTPAGVRAIRAQGDLAPETCAIVDLSEVTESFDLITRVYPFGAGQGRARLTLAASNRTAPTGYTANLAQNYIQKTDAFTTYGLIERWVEFKDIAPLSNTDADLQSAANALFDLARIHLERNSVQARHFTLGLAQCSQVLRPGQTIQVDYRDVTAGLVIDEELNILEATLRIDAQGIRTTRVVVADQDRWPANDVDVIVGRMAEAKIYQAHPQLNANSYTTGYSKNVDESETATFRFRFGSEVVQLQQVLFEFQLLPFESTVKTIGVESMTGGSGELVTDAATGNTGDPSNNTSGAPSVADTGAPSNDTSGTPSTNTSGSPSDNNSGTPSNNTSDGPSNNTSGPSSGTTGPSSGTTGPSSGTTGPSSGTTGPSSGDTGGPSDNTSGTPSTNTSGGSGTLETDAPQGGDTGGGGQHLHDISVGQYGGSGGEPVYFVIAGGGSIGQFQAPNIGTGKYADTVGSGNHTHDVDSHTHTLASHTHSLNNHTHTLGDHTHTLGDHSHSLGDHSHSLGDHSHSLGDHTHSLGNHTHSLGNHTHGLGNHTHSLNNHTHTLGNHTHSLGGHTHSLNNHTHSLNNHTHTLTPQLVTTYGIYREAAENTYEIEELEYRVNSGAWVDLDTADNIGGGWYRLDITSQVMNATTFRPLGENNTVQIRANAAVGYTITEIDGTGPNIVIQTSPAPDASLIGKRILVEGTTSYNGSYEVYDVLEGGYIIILFSSSAAAEFTGTVRLIKTVTIDALLSVRNIIQAIAYL